jgi:tRNA nucleotidyltransferase (CCA-adding enzyme)
LNRRLQLFNEIERHLLEDEKPSGFLNRMKDEARMEEYPFSMLAGLESVNQSPVHHPEGNVWIHTMLVVDRAAMVKEKSRDKRVFMWAALLHDIGKAVATRIRNGRITAYDHDKEGERLAALFLEACGLDKDFTARVKALVRWHMQPMFVIKNLPFAEIERMKREVPAREVALLGFCDRLGRAGEMDEAGEEENTRLFLAKCEELD